MEYERQFAKPKQKPEATQSGVANAAHRNEEAHASEQDSGGEAGEFTAEIARSRRLHRGLESDLKMNKLRHNCAELRSKIEALQAIVREISTDPNANLPINVDRRKQLPKLKLQLRRCVRGVFVCSPLIIKIYAHTNG